MTSETKTKLPRNIAHWAKLRGLKVTYNWRNEQIYFASKKSEFTKNTPSRIRKFRIGAEGNFFQICDGFFDRWAISVGYTVPVPQSRDAFNKALDELVAKADLYEFSEEILKYGLESDLELANGRIEMAEYRYGDVVEWCKKYGIYNKFDRRCVKNYYNILKEQAAQIRVVKKHYNYKIAELAALNAK